MPALHYVYILRCADGTLYTGYACDPEKRAQTHNAGKGAKYTATRLRRGYGIAGCMPSTIDSLIRWNIR